jgi:hypothetical protein
MLEQLIHLLKDDHMNLGDFETFVTLLEEAYRVANYMNTAEWALTKLYQGNRDFVMYYTKFQYLIVNLNWNDALKHVALHCGICKELKDILSIQDLPEDWSCYIMLMKK